MKILIYIQKVCARELISCYLIARISGVCNFFKLFNSPYFVFETGIAEATQATLHEGYAILEALKTPLTDVYGKEVDYECGTIAGHIRNAIDDLVERRKRNDELCDVRKLKLQQLLQLRSCERDTDQVRLVFRGKD